MRISDWSSDVCSSDLHRQQGQADAGVARGGDQRLRHRRRIGVRQAVGRVVEVVEFADAGVAGFKHLDVKLRGHRMQGVGVEARGDAVHRLAPGPERSEEHTSELQSLMRLSYAVFCLKNKI